MTRKILTGLALAAALAQQPLAADPVPSKTKAPRVEVKLELSQAPDPIPVGREATVKIAVTPPRGIALNQYPGITLKLDRSDALRTASNEAFVGTHEPIEDPDKFAFRRIDPLVLKVTPTRAGAELSGMLTFFYCVKASGFCAPGKQEVRLPLRVR
ncbi:MAG: hypothetical protein KBD01_19705 [Acidobacteria bacterium]|nr:hypothetical protein [Acidobacteriota bacterium]